MKQISRRDFLKFTGSTFAGLAFSPFLSGPGSFEDAAQVRVATNSISVYSEPNDHSLIIRQHFRDDIVHVYKEIDAGAPAYNPIWYLVWGGYIHRGRVQKVKTIFNKPLDTFPEGMRQVAELTVPYSQAMRHTKTYGWQPNLRLYYGSVHWIEGIDAGPDGEPWYRIYDELIGFSYHVQAIHLQPIPFEEWSPISPHIPLEDKRIEVNLGTQILSAYENDQLVIKTNISSNINKKHAVE